MFQFSSGCLIKCGSGLHKKNSLIPDKSDKPFQVSHEIKHVESGLEFAEANPIITVLGIFEGLLCAKPSVECFTGLIPSLPTDPANRGTTLLIYKWGSERSLAGPKSHS